MTAAISVAEGVWRIPTAPHDLINSFLIENSDGTLTLVDTGLRNAPRRVHAALAQLRRDATDVSVIALTHAHADHSGGARELTSSVGRGTTVHTEDAGFVERGEGPPLDPATRLGRVLKRSSSAPAAPVENTVRDGDTIGTSGELLVIHTPGHTPGHMSLLHRATDTLITGDAIWNMYSRRTWPVLAFCTDIRLNERSVTVLADAHYTTAAFTHGPHIAGTGRDAVRDFLRRPRRFPGLW